jgi:hypothetical protein
MREGRALRYPSPVTSRLLRASLVVLAACSGAGAGGSETSREFSGPTYASATTSEHLLAFSVRFNPEATPTRGVNAIELTVVDSAGAPRDGLGVSLLPWMPAMNHGSSVEPVISAMGHGRYFADNVSMFMPGRWQLRVALAQPGSDDVDHGTLDIDIP